MTCPTAASASPSPRWPSTAASGATIGGISTHAGLFGEAPSRVIACVANAEVDRVLQMAAEAGIPVSEIGGAGGDRIVIDGIVDLDVADAVEASRTALPRALGIEGASAGAAAS